MSLEGELIEATRARHMRLWGRPKTNRVAMQRAAVVRLKDAPVERWPAYAPPVGYDHFDPSMVSPPAWRDAVNAILNKHGYRREVLAGRSRVKEAVACRREVAIMLREQYTWSFQKIGNFLGGRDHSAILNLVYPERQRERLKRRNGGKLPVRKPRTAYLRSDEMAAMARFEAAVYGPNGWALVSGGGADAEAVTRTKEVS